MNGIIQNCNAIQKNVFYFLIVLMKICTKQLIDALIIMIGQCLYGTIICYPSPAGNDIRARHHLKEDSISWSFYNSISSLFAISGPFVSNKFLKIFNNSRKKTILVLSLLSIVFWLLNCLTKISIYLGLITRALLGVVLGSYSSIDPIYLVEIAPEGLNGFFGCLNQIGIIIGLLLFDFVGPSLTYMELNYLGSGLALLQFCLIWWVDESPTVETLNNKKITEDEFDKDKRKLFQRKYAFGITFGILIMLLQQFCGINSILTNLADLMDKSGFKIDGNYQGGIASCAQLISVFVSAIFIDKIGRKITWIISCSIIIVSLLFFALNTEFNWAKFLPLICIFLFQLGYGLGIGPIPWFIIPEYFNDDVRSKATTIAVASNWLFTFITILVWPYMNSGLGMFGSLLFFMCMTVIAIIFGGIFIKDPVKVKVNDTETKEKLKPDILKEICPEV